MASFLVERWRKSLPKSSLYCRCRAVRYGTLLVLWIISLVSLILQDGTLTDSIAAVEAAWGKVAKDIGQDPVRTTLISDPTPNTQ